MDFTKQPTASIPRYLAVVILGPLALSLVVASAPMTGNGTAVLSAIAPKSPDINNAIPISMETPSPENQLAESDFSDSEDHGIVLDKKEPCEAGHPCGDDQWCSPSRRVCRPCADVEWMCNHTLQLHTRSPACESFCYKIVLDQTHTCQSQNDGLQNALDDKVSAFQNLTQKSAKLEEDYRTTAQELERQKDENNRLTKTLETEKEKHKQVTLELEKQNKAAGYKDNVIVALATVFTISLLWAFAATGVLWYHFFRNPDCRKREGVPDMLPQGSTENETLLPSPTEAEVKIPIQDNTMDSGHFCGNYGQPGIRTTGDNDVIC